MFRVGEEEGDVDNELVCLYILFVELNVYTSTALYQIYEISYRIVRRFTLFTSQSHVNIETYW